jgi:hypothetical protein
LSMLAVERLEGDLAALGGAAGNKPAAPYVGPSVNP